MHRTTTAAAGSPRPARLVLLGALATALLVSACSASHSTTTARTPSPTTSGTPTSSTGGTGSTGSSTSPASNAVITTDAAVRTGMNPVSPVSLSVANGRLTAVTMTNQAGVQVAAQLGAGGTTWHTTEVLGYGKTYTIVAHATGSNGVAASRTTTFTTLAPKTVTDAYMDRMGGYSLDGNTTYGVAIVPLVHFDSPVTDEAAAQKTLSVTTSTPVTGAWSWRDNQDVAYRPEAYWPANTTVTVAANVYGVDLGSGSYGASDESVRFTVGRKELTVADDNAPKAVDKVRVYDAAGHVLRTMNTSMGQHSGETVDGQYINFYTLNGTYTVLEHDNPAIMDSQSYGLPQNAPNGYGKLTVPYSTKISTDGIYLHEYNSTLYDQDHGIDASEGCLNLRTADAVWFYDNTLVGDPVVVHGAPGAPEIQPGEGGYWSIPWATWVKGTATD